jgi:hypothetical protein
MIDLIFMKIYFWGSYIWYALLFFILAVPATIELKKLFSKKQNLGDK